MRGGRRPRGDHLSRMMVVMLLLSGVLLRTDRHRNGHLRLSTELNLNLTNVQRAVDADDAVAADQLAAVVGEAGPVGHQRHRLNGAGGNGLIRLEQVQNAVHCGGGGGGGGRTR